MNYPALEDIYDLSTEELRQLEKILKRNPSHNQQLLETVSLEIEERKTLQFFTKLCEADNPYAKKIADFNDEFIRLAEQAIQKNESVVVEERRQIQTKLKQEKQLKANTYSHIPNKIPKQLTSYCLDEKQFLSSKGHHETENDSRSQMDQKSVQSETTTKNDNMSVATVRSTSKDSQNTEKLARSTLKMGIGFNKKKKNKMAEIISNTLARTKVQTVITIKRSGAQSPIKNKYEKKFHIPGEKHENLQLKKRPPIKPQEPQARQKTQPNRLNKKIDPKTNKNAKQVINRTKSDTKSSVKLPKLNQHLDLVAMVKKEEEQRKIRTEKIIINKNEKQENLPILNKTMKLVNDVEKIEEKIIQGLKDEAIIEDIEGSIDEKGYTSRGSSDTQQQIAEQIDGEVVAIPQEQCEESMSPGKFEKKLSQQRQLENDKPKQNFSRRDIEKPEISKIDRQSCKNETNNEIIISKKSTELQNQTIKQNKLLPEQKYITQQQSASLQTQNNKENFVIVKQNSENTPKDTQINFSKEDKDYTQLLIKQIQQQQKQQYYFFNQENKNIQESSDSDEQRKNIQDKGLKGHETATTTKKQEEKDNKIYSEEYWAHIREEAQLKIKRFRQEKQIEELMEFTNNEGSPQTKKDEENNTQKEIEQRKMSDTAQKFNKQIEKKKAELERMKKKMINRNIPKKNAKPIIPKTVYPKPEFNYLQVYPTFNHIFSTMYMKPAHQANSEIPNLMRELKLLFFNNIQHFQQNKTTFQPALFLPFDHHGGFQIKDPKQLLLHAQNTYVDLKVMVQRIEHFNKNIRGNFENEEQSKRYFRVIKSKQEVYDIITTSFLRTTGWKQLPHGSGLRATWNLFWSWSKPDIDLNKLLVWQKINHFPFNKNLSRKDLLYKNLQFFRKSFRVPMNFLPLTYNLPKEFSQLSIKFHEEEMLNKDTNYWIMKPIGKSRGRGIKVISSLSELNYIDNIVVQKYISNPLLLDGYKFDMRIYVLVTHFHPLQAFVYRQGFARLSTQKFSMDVNSIKNTFIHLTNFSINKNNLDSKSNFVGGSKISLKALKDKLTKMGYSYSEIWKQVHDIIIKSLLGCSISVPSFPGAFQLFGYDVMIDTNGQCHLIEINASPSLERSFIIDDVIKQNMIDDLVEIVNPPDFDKKQLIEVFNERIQMLSENKKITAEDDLIGLARILKYKPIRKIGQIPQKLGLFEVVAPSEASRDLQKLIKSKSGANNPLNID